MGKPSYKINCALFLCLKKNEMSLQNELFLLFLTYEKCVNNKIKEC